MKSMKPCHWLVFGSAIAGCAAALGIHLAAKGSSPGSTAPRGQLETTAKRRVFTNPDAASVRVTEKTAGLTSTAGSAAAEERPGSGGTAPEFRIHGKPPAGRADERAWFASAERVQREANRELHRLRETLELSPSQQQRIFDTYARNSTSWQPGMLVGGAYGVGLVGDDSSSPTSSEPASQAGNDSTALASLDEELSPAMVLAEEIMPILDADQQQALIQEELDRRAWWEEILPQLLAPQLPSASGVDDPAAGLLGNGDTKVYEGSTGLLEE